MPSIIRGNTLDVHCSRANINVYVWVVGSAVPVCLMLLALMRRNQKPGPKRFVHVSSFRAP